MEHISLNKKRIENDKLRMSEPTVLFIKNIAILAQHTVNSFEVGRPDSIASIYYGDSSKTELLLKYNNISNPFSINEGDILNIPNIEGALKQWKPIDAGKLKEPSVRDQFVDSKRLTVKDQKRVEYLQKKAQGKPNGAKQILPPNYLKEGDSNITINNDIITI